MDNQRNIELLKEQLRAKNRELRKKNSESVHYEAKIQEIQTIKERMVSDLKEQIEIKNEALKSIRRPSLTDQTESPESPAEMSAEGPRLDPHLEQTIQDLKEQNQQLSKLIKAEQLEKKKLVKERELLAKAIRKAREKPEAVESLKKEVGILKQKFEEINGRYEKLLDEKNELADSYKKVLDQNKSQFDHLRDLEVQSSKSGEEDSIALTIQKDLEDECNRLRRETEELKEKLDEDKNTFERRLNAEIYKLETEWESKLKAINRDRKKIKQMSDELIDEEPSAPFWMITFSDMSTLLLTLFILYYSLSARNVEKFKNAIMGQKSASVGLLELLDSVNLNERIANLAGLKSNDIYSEMNTVLQRGNLDSKLSVSTDKSRIVLRLPGQTLFKPGESDLQMKARAVLDEIVAVSKKFPEYQVNIQGHTDDVPIESPRFPTNWELSASRATAVLRYFLDKGIDATRLTATGFADIFPIAPNDTVWGRAKNRRVEIVLEKAKKR